MNETVELEGLGAKIRASGDKTILVLLGILVIAGFVFMGWVHHEQMLKDNEEIKEQFSEVVYILSLSPAEREKLNIAMPKGLRTRLKHRRELIDE